MYEMLQELIKPELLVLVPVLYLVGVAIKRSAIADKWIPWILGCMSIILCGLWIFATSGPLDAAGVTLALFTAIVQGVLCAGASVYVNQVVKQAGKEE